MKLKKIVAAIAAAAVAVSTMAISAFAIDLDSEYTGDWSKSAGIAKTEFDKFDGDVKVVLTVEAVNVADGNSYIIKPMDVDKSWDAITSSLTAEKAVCKPDGFMQIRHDQTEVEFVVPKAVKDDLWNGGIAFQVSNVIVKSATLSDGTAENPFVIVSDADTPAYCAGTFTPDFPEPAAPADEATADATEEAAAPAEETAEEAPAEEAAPAEEEVVVDEAPAEEAPAAEEAVEEAPAADVEVATAPAATGNTTAAVIVSVMAVAAAAAVVAKKRK